jgi:hypothetical protein
VRLCRGRDVARGTLATMSVAKGTLATRETLRVRGRESVCHHTEGVGS